MMGWTGLKTIVHRVCRMFGVDIVRYPPPVGFDPHSIVARRARWLAELGVTVLMDVGAHNGGYARQLRAAGYQGRIISFEPLSAAFAELERNARADGRWECRNIALGPAEALAEINVAGYPESSSLLGMRPRHIEALPTSAYVGQETVRVMPLDALRLQILRPDDIVWLKLDVQGYELPVLDGASRTLQQVAALEMEMSLVPLYEGQELISESIRRMEAIGFQLISLEEAFQDAVRKHTLQVNGIFERLHPGGRGVS